MPSQASDRTSSVEGVETRRRPPKCKSCNAYGEGIVQRVGKLTPIGILWSGVQVPDGPPIKPSLEMVGVFLLSVTLSNGFSKVIYLLLFSLLELLASYKAYGCL